MCLAVPMQVVSINGDAGEVTVGKVNYKVNFSLTPEVKVGDYVIIHAGFAIQKLDEDDAIETLNLFKEMEEMA